MLHGDGVEADQGRGVLHAGRCLNERTVPADGAGLATPCDGPGASPCAGRPARLSGAMPLLVLYDGSSGGCLARPPGWRGATVAAPSCSRGWVGRGSTLRAAAFTSGDTVRPDTLVVVNRVGGREVVRVRTDAVASALRALGLPWSLAGLALRAAPRRLADAGLQAVARRRRNKA